MSVSAWERRESLPHFPALDGIRGPFAIAVLSYHAGMGFSGALTMMTGFFVLSGFLITALLLHEWQRTGSIDLLRFVLNRARRLLPAAMLVIVLIAIFWNVLPLMWIPEDANYDAIRRMNVDLLSATFYVYNWRRAYGPEWQGFTALYYPNPPEASPVSHLWSLSVEEQFYAFFPVITLILLKGFRNVWALAGASVIGILAILVFGPWLGNPDGPQVLPLVDRLYNGTDTRMTEVLCGVIVGVVYSTPRGREILLGSRITRTLGTVAALIALYWIFNAHISDWWIYQRGLVVIGAVYALVIAACIQPTGLLVRVVSWSPFRWIGLRTYGLYLYHFPIQCWVDERSVDWGDWTLYGIRMLLSVVAAAVSYEFLELPIRRGTAPRRSWWWAVAGMGFLAVTLTAVTIGVWRPA